jgi:hypothetical protein
MTIRRKVITQGAVAVAKIRWIRFCEAVNRKPLLSPSAADSDAQWAPETGNREFVCAGS